MGVTRMAWIGAIAMLTLALPVVAHEPGPESDYGRSRIGGMRGRIGWEYLLRGKGLDGWATEDPKVWSRDGDALVAKAGGVRLSRLAQGDTSWSNYELKVQGTLEKGANLQIQFRISEDGQDYYFLDFLGGWKALSISKRERGKPGVTKLDVVNFPFKYGREYDIVIAVRGHSITTYIDGQLVNRLSDAWRLKGGVALGIWGKSTIARFRDPKIRHYH